MPFKEKNNITAADNPEKSALDKFWREYEEEKNKQPVSSAEDFFGDIFEELERESAESPVQKAEYIFKGLIARQKDNPFLVIAHEVNPYNQIVWQIDDLNFEIADIQSNITSETPDNIKDKLNGKIAEKKATIDNLKKERLAKEKQLENLLLTIKKQHPDLESLDFKNLKEIGTLYTKELVNQIYYNLDLAQKNHGPKAKIFADLLIGSDDFSQRFAAIKGQKNIFEQFELYNQIKSETNDPVKSRASLDQRVKSKAVKEFILELDKLSGQLGRDVVDSLLRRQNLEKQITWLERDKNIFSYYDEKNGASIDMAQQYGTANDHIQQVLNNYEILKPVMIQLGIKGERLTKDIPESLKILHEDVQNIVKFEIKLLDQSAYEYAGMPEAKKQKIREKFFDISNKKPQTIFDLNVLGFLGEHIEKRYQGINQIMNQYATISRQFSREFL